MKVLFYSTKDFEKPYLIEANKAKFFTTFIPEALSLNTAERAKGYDSISIFTADDASAEVIARLASYGVKHIAVRAAGYDNVDVPNAGLLGLDVANVPEYSPYAIAEHAVAMILALNRKLIIANAQVRRNDFTVANLIGFDMNKKVVGVIGVGRIGRVVAGILNGFGCEVLAFDANPVEVSNQQFTYVSLDELYKNSDVITLHVPLNESTRHLLNSSSLAKMKKGVILVNTARGGVVDTAAAIAALKSGQLGSFGMDVYEYEKGVFFYNRVDDPPNDPLLQELFGMSDVLITPHQAFATREALTNIAEATFASVASWHKGERPASQL